MIVGNDNRVGMAFDRRTRVTQHDRTPDYYREKSSLMHEQLDAANSRLCSTGYCNSSVGTTYRRVLCIV